MARTPELHPDEPWLTLRGQDVLAPYAVLMYAAMLRAAAAGIRHGPPPIRAHYERAARPMIGLLELADDAERIAAEMVAFQATHPDRAKLPD